MGTLTNLIKVLVTSEGSDKAAVDLDKVNKSTTRLGQTSASAARSFSAQSNGLGGLVGAYAGAAATIFAVTQAFSALNRAAQAEQTIKSTEALASAVGQSGKAILKSIQDISRGQLSLIQSSESANLSLAAGFNVDQINNISKVASSASRALGRTFEDAITRLVRGTAKLEPELLDELGIFTRLEPAVEAYALKIGRSAQSLTQFERRQAFVNAVIEEGQRKFSSITGGTGSAAESFNRLSATITDLAVRFGGFVSNVLAPFADAISGNVSNSIAAFGILSTLVFKKGLDLAKDGVASFASFLDTKFNSISKRYAALSSDFKKLGVEAQESVKAFSIQQAPGSGNRNSGAQEARGLLSQLKEGKIDSPRELEKTIASFTKLRDVQQEHYDKLANVYGPLNKAQAQQYEKLKTNIDGFNTVLPKLTTQLQSASKAATALGVAATYISTGVTLIGGAFTRLLGAINFVVLAFSTLQLGLDLFLKLFGFAGVDILDTIAKKIGEVVSSFRAMKDTVASTFGAFADTSVIDALNKLNLTREQADKLQNTISDLATGRGGRRSANQLIAEDVKTLAESTDEEAKKLAKARIILLKELQTLQAAYGNGIFGTLNNVNKQTGIAGNAIVTAQQQGLLRIENNTVGTQSGTQLANRAGILGSNTKEKDANTSLLRASTAAGDLAKKLNETAISGEQSSQILAGLTSQLENFSKTINELPDGTVKNRLQAELLILQVEKDRLKEQVFYNSDLEKQTKLLNTVFKSVQAIGETAYISGKFDSKSGRFISEPEAQRLQQVTMLVSGLADTQEAIVRSGGDDKKNQAELANLRARQSEIAQTLVGFSFQLAEATANQLKDEVLKERALLEQLYILEKQTDLINVQAKNADRQAALQLSLNRLTRNSSETQAQQDVFKAQREASLAQLAVRKTILQGDIERIANEQEIKRIQLDGIAARKQAQKEFALQGAENDLDFAKGNPLTLVQDIFNQEVALVEQRRQLEVSAIEERKKLLEIDRNNALELLEKRTGLLAEEEKTVTAQIINLEANTKAQLEAVTRQESIDRAKLEADIQNARGKIEEINRQEALFNAQNETEEQRQQFELAQRLVQAQLIQSQVDALREVFSSGFIEPLKALFVSYLSVQDPSRGAALRANLNNDAKNAATANNNQAKSAIESIIENITGQQNIVGSLFKGQRDNNKTTLDSQRNVIASEIKNLQEQITSVTRIATQKRLEIEANREKELAGLDAQRQEILNKGSTLEFERNKINEKYNNDLATQNELVAKANQAADQRIKTLQRENSVLFQTVRDITNGVFQTISTNFKEIANEYVRGTLDAKSAIEKLGDGILTNIVDGITENLIVKPTQELLKSAVNFLFPGLFSNKPDGSPINPFYVIPMGSPGAVGSVVGGVAGMLGGNAGLSLGTNLSGFFGSLFGGGGGVGGISNADYGSLSSIVSPEYLTQFAAGGNVKRLAAGGDPGIAGMRDKIPALLEPGEFVTRKSAVDSIGRDNMAAMNALGSKGMTGNNVSVNLTNNGTAQQVDGQPSVGFDGEKFVIDIVLRDFETNGPIRRGMRQ